MEDFKPLVISALFLFCGLPVSANASPSKQSLQIKISGEVYSPTEELRETSVIVAEETNELLDQSDLQALVSDLRRLAKFMRIAYNRAGAAGPKYVDLKIEIQCIGYSITDLCDKTDRTLKKFRKTSKNIVLKRQAAYQFVADGYEEMGVEILLALADDTTKMKGAALELHREFRRVADEVIATLEHTQSAKAKQDVHFRELRSERMKMEETKTQQQQVVEEAEKRKMN